jgi:hypothetical protein
MIDPNPNYFLRLSVLFRFFVALICVVAEVASVGFAQERLSQDTGIQGTVTAAQQLMSSLDATQREKLVFDFRNDEQRKRWSNLPFGLYKREGLRMGDLTQTQRDAVWSVLSAALSKSGYEKVFQIVESDEALKKESSGSRGGPGRSGPGGGPGGLGFGRDNYFVSFLGNPSATEPWMIQFGGHHLGINITMVGDKGTLAPSHTGAQPATFELEGKSVRPLGDEVDKAFSLVNSLNEDQRKQAILGFQMRDLVLGPGREGKMIEPEGIKGDKLTEQQRTMLLDLAGEWTGIIQESCSSAKMDEMKKNVNETWFAWSGPTEVGSAAYFRIQGPTVFIEFAPQKMGGDPTNHIHTILRDPTSEYGARWWKK